MEQTTTCQICARAIKANTGVIAHHGYKRPGEGWQTASCWGARYVAYEVGHDRLDQWIIWLQESIPNREASLARYRDNPPAKYTVGPKDGYGVRRWTREVEKPEGFDGNGPSPGSWTPYTYEAEFWHNVHDSQRNVKGMKQELERCTSRRKAWKSPFRSDVPFPA